jgi:hypothetical protein
MAEDDLSIRLGSRIEPLFREQAALTEVFGTNRFGSKLGAPQHCD